MITVQINVQPKVLLLTHEYGRRIQGGLGRVVNGVFNTISTDVILDIYLLKFFSAGYGDLAYVYRKESNNVKCQYTGNYLKILHHAFQTEKYDMAHVMVNSPFTAECVREIKAHYPEVKIIYSCHSIAKFEMSVRNNSATELIHEEYLLNNADQIQVLNHTSLQYLMKSYSSAVEKKSITIVPNGIDEGDYKLIDHNFKKKIQDQLKSTDIIVFCLSRWSFGKGLEFLIESIAKIIDKKPTVKFVIAGRKTESWENKVEEYVDMIDKKMEPYLEHIIPLGWLDNTERNTLFSMADICVMPSMLEYFPYGILEPMICQVPIVSSKIDSVEELLVENKECLFFPPGNTEELAEKILFLIENEDRRKDLVFNAYKKVNDHYRWQTISSHYVDMYQSLLQQKN
jgi:glycosyltransferase involved in cell wall biosynthesis